MNQRIYAPAPAVPTAPPLSPERYSEIIASIPAYPPTDDPMARAVHELAAEVSRLQTERAETNSALSSAVEALAVLHPQECAAQQHRGWFADKADGPLPCPWCRIAELEVSAGVVYVADHHDIPLDTYSSVDAAGAHCEAAMRDLEPSAVCIWQAGEPGSEAIELVADRGQHTEATGFHVATVTVKTEYARVVTA